MDSQATPAKRVLLSRDWRKTLETDAAAGPLKVPCNLGRLLPCCGGKGYRVDVQGALAHATLCQCVANCPGCFGRARQMEGNDSRACLTPAPNIVVNLINSALIPARYAEASLERFSNFSGNGRTLVDQLMRWRTHFRPVLGQGVIIEGPVGVGKTYLLAAMAKDFAERGLSVRFSDFFQLLGELKTGFSQGKADATQLAPLIDVDVLFIDELGKGRNNDFELTVLDQLVCGRYNQNKTIIASTNYRLKGRAFELNTQLDRDPGGGTAAFASDRFSTLEQRIGPRIFSRLREMSAFRELTGDDWRREENRRSARP